MTLPIVELLGSAREQGRAHGEALRDRVRNNVEVYYERLEREAMLSRDETQRRATLYLEAIRRQNAGYAAAMDGLAQGSGCDLVDIAMLNVRYELLYYQFGVGGANASPSSPDSGDAASPSAPIMGDQKSPVRINGGGSDHLLRPGSGGLDNPLQILGGAGEVPEPDGCTAFALLPSETANGHLLIGQNWDWIPETQGAVLKTTDADGTRVLSFTEAGIVGGKIGVSSNGIALCINGMTTTSDDWSTLRKPFHVRCYEILRAKSFDDATRVVTGEPRACTTNYLIAGEPDRVIDLETAPDVCNSLHPGDGGQLVHTNNFLDPEKSGVEEALNPRRRFSVGRCDRMSELLAATPRPITTTVLETMLRDHIRWPYGICRHRAPDEPPQRHYITVTSVIIDVDAKEMHLTDGPPCEGEYQSVQL